MKTPFTPEQFFHVFEEYNSAVFPFQLIILALGVAGIFMLHSGYSLKHKFIGSYLGFLWIWVGSVYHISFFSAVNPAARAFGIIFIIQGILILFYSYRKERLKFSFIPGTRFYIGYFLIIFALLIYPLIGYLVQNSFPRTISLGLPCPTTIVTLGFFLLTGERFPKYLLIIPVLWSLLGVTAAINFGVYQDFVMLLSAIVAIYFLVIRNKEKLTPAT